MALVVFIKKKDGSLRLCVDYLPLNQITIRNQYPLPLIPEMLDCVRFTQIFVELDLQGAYSFVQVICGNGV